MKRRRLLQAMATAGVAGASGCVSVRLADPGGDGGAGTPTATTLPVPSDFGLSLCSEDDTAIYRISNPRFTLEENEVAFEGTIEYVGENTGQFAVNVDLQVTYYDESGDQIGRELQSLRFAPDAQKEFLVTVNSRDDEDWEQTAAFTVGVRDPTGGGDGEDGCLADEFADPESGGDV